MTPRDAARVSLLLEAIQSRHAPKRGKNYGDRTLREVQTYKDVCQALRIIRSEGSK